MLIGNVERDDQSILHSPCKRVPIKTKEFILIYCSISLAFTFLYVTNQAKALILDGAFEFH